MNNLNSILIEGNLVRDPEFRTTTKGTALCEFSIASNRYYKAEGGGLTTEVSFFDVECWSKMAENVKKLGKKGRGARVGGRIKQNRWTSADGKEHSKIIIVGEHIEFCPEPLKQTAAEETQSEIEEAF